MGQREHELLFVGLAAPLFAFVANWTVGVNTVSTPNARCLRFAAGVIFYWLPIRESGPFEFADRVAR